MHRAGKLRSPKVVGGTRQRLSMISTVTNQGESRWQVIDGSFSHEQLSEFCEAFEAFIECTEHTVFLVLDNLSVHHCKPVKTWLEQHRKQIAGLLPAQL